MLRNLVYFLILLLVLLLVTAFAALNPGSLALDVGFRTIEIQKSLALTLAFAAGWLFGIGCAGLLLLKSAGERRRLRKSLRLAESEVKALRNLPIQDAD
ncbi:MAG: hypothetical protein D6727_03640 [Gammaproteobacteria bacterium]|nr:MAG: hypothetical protein D6727_03640 [Gammaproteobacteria bacterium]